MAGEILLHSGGGDLLNASGQIILNNGTGNACCCPGSGSGPPDPPPVTHDCFCSDQDWYSATVSFSGISLWDGDYTLCYGSYNPMHNYDELGTLGTYCGNTHCGQTTNVSTGWLKLHYTPSGGVDTVYDTYSLLLTINKNYRRTFVDEIDPGNIPVYEVELRAANRIIFWGQSARHDDCTTSDTISNNYLPNDYALGHCYIYPGTGYLAIIAGTGGTCTITPHATYCG